MQEAIAEGREPAESENMIREPNGEFTKWWTDNKQRVASAKSLPYWVKDNKRALGLTEQSQLQTAIKLGASASKHGREAKNLAYKALSNHTELHNYTDAQMGNFRKIEEITGWKRGNPMSFEEADNGSANVVRDNENCAACVLVHELRLRGFDVTALGFNSTPLSDSIKVANCTRLAWLTEQGDIPKFKLINGKKEKILSQLEKETQGIGSRYHLGWDHKIAGGHIVTVERTQKGLVIYDPQQNDYLSIGEIVNDMKDGSNIELLRVDNLCANSKLLNSLVTAMVKRGRKR